MELKAFTREAQNITPIVLLTEDNLETWLETQPEQTKHWVAQCAFKAKAETFILEPDASGTVQRVIAGIESEPPLNFWGAGFLSTALPEGVYQFAETSDVDSLKNACMAWGLGAYQFTEYKKAKRKPAQLCLPTAEWVEEVEAIVHAIYHVRDLINLPAEDLQPEHLSAWAKRMCARWKAKFTEISGDALKKAGYNAIYTVGRAAVSAPRLIDIRWGDPKHPKLTLVGKGVCYDTGGLDVKPGNYMRLMKKDMGGAAHVLGLAHMIMQLNVPVCLRVLVPAVENAIGSHAYRPGDIIKTRKGLTLEIGDTDAEGRVILADALDEAARENPDLLIDFATLTGSARVALGEVVPVFFCNNATLSQELMTVSEQTKDPMWPLPLYQPYRETLKSSIADLCNISSSRYGDAIMAGLLLETFIKDEETKTAPDWLHFDFMGWNYKTASGRPEGGEAMALRAVLAFIKKRYH